MGVGCCHCQQISVPGSTAPPKLRTAKCAWVDSTSKTQGIGVGDRSRKRNTSRCFDAWSRFAHHCFIAPCCSLGVQFFLAFLSSVLVFLTVLFDVHHSHSLTESGSLVQGQSDRQLFLLKSNEAQFLDEIQTKLLRAFLLATHSHLYTAFP